MKLMNDLDYVQFYAEKLKDNNELFKQQKMLIESQLRSSTSIFSNLSAHKNFKAEARKYLKSVGII